MIFFLDRERLPSDKRTVQTLSRRGISRQMSRAAAPAMAAPLAAKAEWSQKCELLGSAKAKHGAEERELPLFETWKLAEGEMDVVAYLGGPIWSMAWRPPRPNQPGLLAAAARPKTNVNQNIYQHTMGPGCVQLWQLNHEASTGEGNRDEQENAPPRADGDSRKTSTKTLRSVKGKKSRKLDKHSSTGEQNAHGKNTLAPKSQVHPEDTSSDDRGATHDSAAHPSLHHDEINSGRKESKTPAEALALVGAILHEGKITWDLAWHPQPHTLGIGKDAEGALAMALGGGTVEVHEIPPLEWMSAMGSPGVRRAIAKTKVLQPDRPCSIKWNPAVPEQLLVGCWSGHVSVLVLTADTEVGTSDANQEAALLMLAQNSVDEGDLQVEKKRRVTRALAKQYECPSYNAGNASVNRQSKAGTASEDYWSGKVPNALKHAFQLTMRIQADECPLRKVCWAPFGFSEEYKLFATIGHSSVLKIWDLRDPFAPQIEMRVSREWVLDLQWSPKRPRNIVMCVEDGSLRVVNLLHVFPLSAKERVVRTDRQPGRRTLWTASVSPLHGLLAFGGEDGEVTVGHIPMNEDKRKNLPMYKCAQHSFCPSSQTVSFLQLKQQDPLPKQNQRFAVKDAKDGDQDPYALLPHPSNWITRVEWNPSPEESPSKCLAYGTASGFLRLLQIEGVTEPADDESGRMNKK